MIRPNGRDEKRSCPYIDGDDPRCASHFTLSQIDQAFSLCLNNHECCSTFKNIRHESQPVEPCIHLSCSIERCATPAMLSDVSAAIRPAGT